MKNFICHYDMAKYAYQQIYLYQEIAQMQNMNIEYFDWKNDWERLPIIRKNILRGRMADLIAPQYILLEGTPRMQSVFTSGTTGQCMEISWLIEDMKMSFMPLWLRRLKRYQIKPQDMLCTFYSVRQYSREDNWYYIGDHEISFAKEELNERKLTQIYDKLVECKVKWMILQPSIIILLFQFIKNNSLPVWKELSYIELTGEYISDLMYQRLKDFFRVPILNQYGTHEVNSIAYGEGTKFLDIVDRNVYVEIVDEDGNSLPEGEEGDICVTSLTNRAMPFVRYIVGDKGIKKTIKGSNGEEKQQLYLSNARCSDMIYLKNGKLINPYVLQKAIEVANFRLDDIITQFCFVQQSYNEIIVHLVVSEEYDFNKVCEVIKTNIYQDELRELNFIFKKENYNFFDLRDGKLGWYYSKIS